MRSKLPIELIDLVRRRRSRFVLLSLTPPSFLVLSQADLSLCIVALSNQIITLLSKGTVDEDINDLALSKLRLDDAVAGRTGAAAEDEDQETEGKMKASLLTTLRNKLDKKTANVGASGDVTMEEEVKDEEEEILEEEARKEEKEEKEERKFAKEEKKRVASLSAGVMKGKEEEGKVESVSDLEEPTQMDVV